MTTHSCTYRYPTGSPEQRKAGTWLAGGWRATLFALTGDLDYLCAILGVPKHSLVSGPCILCKCTGTGANTWCDFRGDAPWRDTRWDPTAWHAYPERTPLSLLTLPGCSCYTVHYDYMHCKHLGLDMYIFGSVLALLVNSLMPDEPEQNLQNCWKYLKQFFKDNATPTPFRYLTKLSMFLKKGDKFPKLRGKASEVRHLGPALTSLWERHMNQHLVVHKRIYLLLKANVKLENMLTEHREDYAFPPAAAQEFEETCSTMLLLLTQVAEHFIGENMKLFDITGKSHFVQEIAIMSRCINPRVTWAYQGEDLQQKMQTIAKACARGVRIDQQSTKLARHYRLALHLLFRSSEA